MHHPSFSREKKNHTQFNEINGNSRRLCGTHFRTMLRSLQLDESVSREPIVSASGLPLFQLPNFFEVLVEISFFLEKCL